ncbi:MAG: DUF1214 domain-containing protein [Actinobacteria bacterium]|nr:MAG: DUF1214 domain-containing protein [Actinomycetota bacterium]
MTDTNHRLVQESWRQVLHALRAGDALFDDPARVELDDHELALGYRNLTHILAFSIGLQMNADRDWPSFAPSLKDPPGEKTLGEHPDVHYEWAPIRGGRRYRITGQRGDEAYLSFTVHRGVRGSGSEQWFDSHLNQHDIKTDSDGRFEIIVSGEPEGDNWLRASSDANEIYARAYHFDLANERTASYRIEPLDPRPPQPLSSRDVAERLQHMARLIADMTAAWPQPLHNPNTAGELWKPDVSNPSRMWSAIDNVYNRGVFHLEHDEALLLEGEVVPSDYWGIQLWTPFLGSGDYRHQRVTINTEQAHLGPNREFRVAIARTDLDIPGLDSISTAGERQGTFFVRWMCATREPPTPTCRLVKIADLR